MLATLEGNVNLDLHRCVLYAVCCVLRTAYGGDSKWDVMDVMGVMWV